MLIKLRLATSIWQTSLLSRWSLQCQHHTLDKPYVPVESPSLLWLQQEVWVGQRNTPNLMGSSGLSVNADTGNNLQSQTAKGEKHYIQYEPINIYSTVHCTSIWCTAAYWNYKRTRTVLPLLLWSNIIPTSKQSIIPVSMPSKSTSPNLWNVSSEKAIKSQVSILCDVIFLVRLQEKFEIDHSWEWSSSSSSSSSSSYCPS